MGKIITLSTRELFATENCIEYMHLKEILTKVVDGKFEEIPPIYVQRFYRQEGYGIIDGHHRATIYDLIQIPIRCWEAEHSADYMPIERFPLNKGDSNSKHRFECTNEVIRRRFVFVRDQDKWKGDLESTCDTIPEFRKKFPYLQTLEDAKKYFKLD